MTWMESWDSSVWGTHCTRFNLQCTTYTVHCTPHVPRCRVYTVQCTVYIEQCTRYILTNVKVAIVLGFNVYKVGHHLHFSQTRQLSCSRFCILVQRLIIYFNKELLLSRDGTRYYVHGIMYTVQCTMYTVLYIVQYVYYNDYIVYIEIY